MRAGALDRRVTIQQKSVTKDVYGAEVTSWSSFAEVWAEIREVNSVEKVIDRLRTMTRMITVKTRYVSGVTTDMRILLDDGRYLQIMSLAVIGKKLGWSMVCDEYSN